MPWYDYRTQITSVEVSQGVIANADSGYLFYGLNKATQIDVYNLDTSNVTNMYGMFAECYVLTSLDVTGFNTSSVTDMNRMFFVCRELAELDLSNFDMSGITNSSNVDFMLYYVGGNLNGGCKLTLNNTFNNATYATSTGYSFPWEYYAKEESGTLSSNLYTLAQMQTEVTGSQTATTWVPAYSVTYDKNTGDSVTGTPNPKVQRIGTNVDTRGYDAIRTGYTFNNWKTSPSGGTTFAKNTLSNKAYGAKYVTTGLTNGNVALYAQYTVNTYTIKFDANTGIGSMSNLSMTYNVEKNLTKNTFTKTGYNFTGWNTKADGTGNSYSDEQSVKNLATSGEVTLYAQWQGNDYTIAFNSNGGTGSMSNEGMTYGVAKELYANSFIKKGCSFTGWNTKADGTGTSYSDEAEVNNLTTSGTFNLYAQWEKYKSQMKYVDNEAELNKDINDNYLYQNIKIQKNSFTILLRDKDNNSVVIPNAKFNITGTSTYGNPVNTTITTGANGKAEFTNIEYGTYTLTEIEVPEEYKDNDNEYTIVVNTNVTSSDLPTESGSFIIENELKVVYSDIKVTTKIEGNMADTDKNFNYTMIFTGAEKNKTYTIEGTPNSFTTDSSGNASVNFTLKHNGEITFKNIPDSTKYQVTQASSLYTPRYNLVSDGTKGEPVFVRQTGSAVANSALSTEEETQDKTDGNVTVKFTNNYNSEIETGVFKENKVLLIFVITSLIILIYIIINLKRIGSKQK